MFDPIKLSRETEKIVYRGGERKYYRFRPARFYGGIATADAVGCNLRCKFCWAWNVVTDPKNKGKFYAAEKVAHNLENIARKFGFNQLRISGNEPTIGKDHLLSVLGNLKNSGCSFILETNGILIGYDKSYANALAEFNDFLHARVSLKVATPESFSKITGAKPEYFDLQLRALENLVKADIACNPSVMTSFSSAEEIEKLKERLAKIKPQFRDFEVEELMFFGNVKQRLEKANIKYSTGYSPKDAPGYLV